MNRTKLQKILNVLDGTSDKTASAIRDFEDGVKTLRKKLQQEIEVSTLADVNSKINGLRKSIDLNPIIEGVQKLESNFKESTLSMLNDIESKTSELRNLTIHGDQKSYDTIDALTEDIKTLERNLEQTISSNQKELQSVNIQLSNLIDDAKTFATKEEMLNSISEGKRQIVKIDTEKTKEIKDISDNLKGFRSEFMTLLVNKGGGNMNRNIAIGGNTSVLSKYTDINIKPGSNVTLTYQNNDTTKYLDLTISSSGSSSVGGTVRQITTLSVSSTIGTLTGTDQVYLCNQGIRVVLPTPVSDTNLYTIKNVSNSSILIVGTIDDDANGIIMPIKYTSVDLISNDTTFNIT